MIAALTVAASIVSPLYDRINALLDHLGIEAHVDSLVDLGLGLAGVLLIGTLVAHLIFDD